MEFKQQLASKAESIQKQDKGIKLTTNMAIEDMIKALEPEIKKA